jgi:hypothetical protein
MNKQPTYYAIIDQRATVTDPAGIARRRQEDDGGFSDEALSIDLSWKFTPLIAEWERGESSPDLVKVTPDEAQGIIERLAARWGSAE